MRLHFARQSSALEVLAASGKALTLLSVLAGTAAAQSCDPRWLDGQGIPGTWGGSVVALETLPNGGIFVGNSGSMVLAGDQIADRFAVYSTATGQWSPLSGAPAAVAVRHSLRLANSDILVAADFSDLDGQAKVGLARYIPGSGLWQRIGAGLNSGVYDVATAPNGDIIVGGSMTIAGAATKFLARYQSASGQWISVPGRGAEIVRSIAILPSGETIAGGSIRLSGLTSLGYVGRYDWNTSSWNTMQGGCNGVVNAVLTLPNGNVLVGGQFSQAGGITTGPLALYKPATDEWSTVSIVPDGSVTGLSLTDSGNILMTGSFQTVSGQLVKGLAKIDANALAVVPTPPAMPLAMSISVARELASGELMVGGLFTKIGDRNAFHIARLSNAATAWVPLDGEIDGRINYVGLLPSGELLAVGEFGRIGGVDAPGAAAGDPAAQTWHAFGTPDFGPVLGHVNTPQGDLFFIRQSHGTDVSAVFRLSPASGEATELGTIGSQSDNASAIALASTGVIVGGTFSSMGSVAVDNIARFDTTLGVWKSLGGGVDGSVSTIAVTPDDLVVVGGTFSSAGGIPAPRIAAFDLRSGTWSSLGTLPTDQISYMSKLVALPNGDVVAFGSFNTIGGVPATRLARYSHATQTWSPIPVGSLGGSISSVVRSMLVLPDGRLAVGGAFSSVAGVPVSNIAVYDFDSGVWSPIGAGVSGEVFSLAIGPAGELCAAGNFATAGGRASAYLARFALNSNPVIVAQPESATVCGRAKATFAVNATAAEGTLSFQWRKGNQPIDALANPSAASPTLVLPRAIRADNASYDCVVTNSCGSVTTIASQLRVCIADVDCSGVVDLDDFFAWFNAWDTGGELADVTDNGTVDASDFFEFFDGWDVAC